nr:hypothetical protein [Tanacetum cinerariifolium]
FLTVSTLSVLFSVGLSAAFTNLIAGLDKMCNNHLVIQGRRSYLREHQVKWINKTPPLPISQLKARVKLLEDRDGGGIAPSREDALIKGRSLDEGEEAGIERSTEKGSNDTEEMLNVLTSLDAASVLSSKAQVSVPPAIEVAN